MVTVCKVLDTMLLFLLAFIKKNTMVTLPFILHLLQVIIETMLTTVCNRFDTMQPNCSHQLLQNNLLSYHGHPVIPY